MLASHKKDINYFTHKIFKFGLNGSPKGKGCNKAYIEFLVALLYNIYRSTIINLARVNLKIGCRSSGAEHSLGKGEAESSNLSGSTIVQIR